MSRALLFGALAGVAVLFAGWDTFSAPAKKPRTVWDAHSVAATISASPVCIQWSRALRIHCSVQSGISSPSRP